MVFSAVFQIYRSTSDIWQDYKIAFSRNSLRLFNSLSFAWTFDFIKHFSTWNSIRKSFTLKQKAPLKKLIKFYLSLENGMKTLKRFIIQARTSWENEKRMLKDSSCFVGRNHVEMLLWPLRRSGAEDLSSPMLVLSCVAILKQHLQLKCLFPSWFEFLTKTKVQFATFFFVLSKPRFALLNLLSFLKWFFIASKFQEKICQ